MLFFFHEKNSGKAFFLFFLLDRKFLDKNRRNIPNKKYCASRVDNCNF